MWPEVICEYLKNSWTIITHIIISILRKDLFGFYFFYKCVIYIFINVLYLLILITVSTYLPLTHLNTLSDNETQRNNRII